MMLEKCSYCGKLFIKKSNANKYCCNHCRHESILESKRKHINKKNTRKSYNTRIKNITELGSWGTTSTSHRKKDFREEYQSIRSQMKILRI